MDGVHALLFKAELEKSAQVPGRVLLCKGRTPCMESAWPEIIIGSLFP